MPFIFCLLIAWYLVYRAGGDLATGAARVTAAAADRLATTAEHLGERGDGLRRQATATAKKLRDRPAPTTPRTHAGQSLSDDLAGVVGAVIGWLRLVWVDATAAAESAQARRGTGPHTVWWDWPSGDEPQAPIHADAERLDRTDEPSATDPAAVGTGKDLGWMGFASEAGRHLISENRCAWGGGGQPFCGAPRDGDYQFCPRHAQQYADELGQRPDPVMPSPAPGSVQARFLLEGDRFEWQGQEFTADGTAICHDGLVTVPLNIDGHNDWVELPAYAWVPVNPEPNATPATDESPVQATAGCPWIPPGTGRACGQPLYPGSPYCAGHHVVGRYTECLWGDGNPNVPPCPHQRAQHQPFCEAHLAEYTRRTATAVDTSPGTPIQATAQRLDTPALPAASSDRLAITDGRNGSMETAAESGLGAYLSYSTNMANSCQDGVNSIDTTIGALETQDWSGEPIEALGRAKESLATAASAFGDAHDAFQRALAVAEAYAANDHAGTKESVTAV
jgi:hypothetical protein